MKMNLTILKLLVLLTRVSSVVGPPLTSTPAYQPVLARPDAAGVLDNEKFEFADLNIVDSQALCAELLFPGGPLTKEDAIKVLQQALSILSGNTNRRRSSFHLDLAENLVQTMVGRDYVSHHADDSSIAATSDEDYCPADQTTNKRRKYTPETARIIVGMYERGASIKTIKAKDRWYQQNYLPALRNGIAGGSPTSKAKQIDEYVLGQARRTREENKILRGWMLKNWAMQRALEIDYSSFKASEHWLYKFNKRNGLVSLCQKKMRFRAKTELGKGMFPGQISRSNCRRWAVAWKHK